MPGEMKASSNDPKRRKPRSRRRLWNALWPNQRLKWTKEGLSYILVWLGLLATGLYQQINLILLVAGLAAGPVVASILVSAGMLRRLRVTRRVPAYVFSGDPMTIDYTLHNDRRWTAALALFLDDDLIPNDRSISGAPSARPALFFPKVSGRDRVRYRWQGPSPKRGKYRLRSLELATRSPFGLIERRLSLSIEDDLIVYPTVGHLTRRWHLVHREATETRRGLRPDRSIQQQEYHGLRDYRPGDNPRWIHWRTSARIGKPMIKEFEEEHEQDVAVLVDPWLPRSKVTQDQRDALEEAIKFAATLSVEACRSSGRRFLLGWTGATPGLRQGPATVKLLHEVLEQLAVMKSSSEASLAALFDLVPPSLLRQAVFVIVSTRPINLVEESEKSKRLSGASSRGLLGRATVLDASRKDLAEFVEYGQASRFAAEGPRNAAGPPESRPASQQAQGRPRTTTEAEDASRNGAIPKDPLKNAGRNA